ncbi:hypothetical protein [Sorangium sp. So ce362]|uniref:hypothetical protein n=1 Tax=Sorangium sp. So ce362 TaxID=3133303 RepID=UPI003F6458F9
MQELRDVTARRGRHRRERAHDALRVVEREGRDGDAAGDRIHVAVKPVDVLFHAPLRLDRVGDHARELARGPELAELLEGDMLRRRAAAVLGTVRRALCLRALIGPKSSSRRRRESRISTHAPQIQRRSHIVYAALRAQVGSDVNCATIEEIT